MHPEVHYIPLYTVKHCVVHLMNERSHTIINSPVSSSVLNPQLIGAVKSSIKLGFSLRMCPLTTTPQKRRSVPTLPASSDGTGTGSCGHTFQNNSLHREHTVFCFEASMRKRLCEYTPLLLLFKIHMKKNWQVQIAAKCVNICYSPSWLV